MWGKSVKADICMRRVLVTLAVVFSLVVAALAGPSPADAQEPRPEDPGSGSSREAPAIPDFPEPETPPAVPNAGPLSPPTEPTSSADPPAAVDRALGAAIDSGEPVEVVEWRTETSITFVNPDGSFTEERAAGPVRVETDGGEWVPADATLIAEDGQVRPKAAPNDIVLSDGGNDEPLMRVTDPGERDPGAAERRTGEAAREAPQDRTVTLDVPEELPAPRLDGNRATYPEVLDGADLVVTASTVGSEVSVVIPEPGQGRDVYELPLGLEGLTAEQDKTGGLVLRDGDGNQVGYSPAPVMFDAVSEPTGLRENYGEVASRLEERNGQQVLIVEPDPEFLTDPETKYPVTIDPATDLYPSRDTYVQGFQPNQANDSSLQLQAGTHPWTASLRTFIRFGTSAFEDKFINSGELILNQTGAASCTATPVDVYEATALPAGATWNTQPTVIGPKRGTANTTGDQTNCPGQVGHKTINIKTLIDKWADDAPTTGTLTVRASESNDNHRKVFSSAESGWGTPILRVNYATPTPPPTNLKPGAGATVDTLAPVLKATVSSPDGGTLQARFSLRDASNTEVATHVVPTASGEEAAWQVESELLRPGQSYTWTATACNYFAFNCSGPTNGSFTVNPSLGAGDRTFFTYTTTDVSDRSTAKVNVASGSLVLTNTDLDISGTNMNMAVTRTYNSFGGGGDKMFGHKWTASHSNTVRIEEHPDGSFSFYDESGFVSLITKDGNDYHTSGDLDATFDDPGYVYRLRFNHDRGQRKQGEKLYFNKVGPEKGLLHSTVNRNGQGNAMDYASGSATLEGIVDSQGRRTDFLSFDGGGHVTQMKDQAGNRTANYVYDGAGDLREVVDLEGNTTYYEYDGSHNLTKITDPNGGIIRVTYDGAARVTSITRENNGVDETTTFAYTDPASPGQDGQTVVTDDNTNTTTYLWDNANRVTRTTNALGQNEDTGYDPNSNVTRITQPGNRVMRMDFDGRNNPRSSKLPTDAESTATYPSAGNVLDYQADKTTDAQGNEVGYEYDSAGNMTGTDNQFTVGEDKTDATYEDNQGSICGAPHPGLLCTTEDANEVETRYEYDAAGNLTRVVPAAPLGDTDITYDVLSRVATIEDGKGQVRSFTYDNLDRVETVTYNPGNVTFTFVYDDNGNITDRNEASGLWEMAYDDANRLLTQDGPEDLEFTYDGVGNSTSVTNSNGTTEYDYTDINMLEKLRDPQNAETVYTYEPDDGTRREEIEYPNGVTIDFILDDSGRITRSTARNSSNGILTDDRYTFEDTGNDTTLRQTWTNKDNVERRYDYDVLNRLTKDQPYFGGNPAGTAYSYNYDGVGNIKKIVKGSNTTTYTHNDADQINGATHDANGSITATSNYGITAASYNSLDQTTSFTPNGASTRSNTYAGATQGHWLTTGAIDFDSTASMGITRTDDGTVTEFTREPDGTLVSMRRGGNTYYYIHDGRGSVSMLTKPDGSGAENTYTYGPYGTPEINIQGTPQPFRWNSGYTTNNNLYKFGARHYDSTIGRWTQVDSVPSEPRYAFAGGDPINNADPTGMAPWGDCLLPGDDGDNGCTGGSLSDPSISLSYAGLLASAAAATYAVGACLASGVCAVAGFVLAAVGLGISVASLMWAYRDDE